MTAWILLKAMHNRILYNRLEEIFQRHILLHSGESLQMTHQIIAETHLLQLQIKAQQICNLI